jgi:acyl carrier protein
MKMRVDTNVKRKKSKAKIHEDSQIKKLKGIFSKTFDIDISEIDKNSYTENISNWDSLNHLLLVNEIEISFNVELTMDEVETIKKFADILNILKTKGVL